MGVDVSMTCVSYHDVYQVDNWIIFVSEFVLNFFIESLEGHEPKPFQHTKHAGLIRVVSYAVSARRY